MESLNVLYTKPVGGFGYVVEIGQCIQFGHSYGCHMHLIVSGDMLTSLDLVPDELYVIESNIPEPDEPVDVISADYKTGVQIRRLDEVIAYNRQVGNRLFIAPLISDHRANLTQRWSWVRHEMDRLLGILYSAGYDRSVASMGSALFDSLNPLARKTAEDKQSFYCSQLISYLYRKLGIIERLPPTGDRLAPHSLLADRSIFSTPFEV